MRPRFVLFALILAVALLSSPLMVQAPSNNYWFDTSWHFRVNLTINNTNYDRDFWPIELSLNFTDLIRQAGKNGTFDYSSIRVVEQNSSGGVMYQMRYQFENASGFDVSTNAAGTLVFILNGTTAANQTRYATIYFDTIENGAKSPISFSRAVNYTWTGEEAQVNNTQMRWRIGTARGENTSGLTEAKGMDGTIIFTNSSPTSITTEYIKYSNATHNLSFDLRNNATFSQGPVRLIMEQNGPETIWNNPGAATGFGKIKKRYIFYENSSWIKIEQNFTNTGGSPVMRNSTRGGALSINKLSDTYFFNGPPEAVLGNGSNPMSWYAASSTDRGIGIINYNYSNNTNYYAVNDSGLDLLGISLDNATVPAGGAITETAVMYFKPTGYTQNSVPALRNQLLYPPAILQSNPEFIPYSFNARQNYTLYNRGETVLIFGNNTADPYTIVSAMNATLDMGNITIALYDDGNPAHGDAAAGDGIFSNLYNLSNSSATVTWNVTVTAYDAGGVLISRNSTLFDVTSAYNTSVNISNPVGFVSRPINATITVKNARYDTFIGGAALNCSYGAGQLTNITDYNNGTYLLNLTAPSTTGNYLLNCTASKFNNTGWGAQPFSTETPETTALLNISPQNHTSQNITLSQGDWFNITINATDTGGANAKAANVSLSMPQNMGANSTFEACGDINMGTSCIKSFNISVNNGTAPGNYTLNATLLWLNPDGITNSTNISFTTYVLSNPVLDASPSALLATIADGRTSAIGNITARSAGNDNLTNVTFNVSGLSNFTIVFSPPNISALGAGASQNVSVNVTIPGDFAPGTYNGTINVSSANDGWKIVGLNITIPPATAMLMAESPQNYTSSAITLALNDSFNMTANATNMGAGSAKAVNITLSMPQKLAANSTFESCGNLNVSASCIKGFNITVMNQTAPGNYTFNITATWRNPDSTTNSTTTNFTVAVLSNPVLNVSAGGISAIVPDNSSVVAGNFTVYSVGNDNITNVAFNVSGLSNFTITFSPANISSLGPNANQTVTVNVSVPFVYPAGNYSGTINITSANDGWKTAGLNISVPIRRQWNIAPLHCDRAENPETGTACLVTISDKGNAPVNITIAPYNTSYTYANVTNITLTGNSSQNIAFMYNVTNITKQYYNENYTINATNPDAMPLYYNFSITLVPYIVPLFSINIAPNETSQKNNVELSINVTDRSTTGINWTSLNVTLPNGTVEAYNMSLIGINGTVSRWYFNYSGNMSAFINYSGNVTGNVSNYTGSTLLRGRYNITISSQDNTGVMGQQNASFNIYAKTVIGFYTGKPEYYQGSTGNIYYTLTDAAGTGLDKANVTITLKDPGGNLTYLQSFTTDSGGQILPIPAFSLTNDAPTGIYNITANMTYYDAIANKALASVNNASFTLQPGSSGGGGGLKSTVRTTVVWYPNNVMNFEMWFSYAGNMTTPDNATLNVYDPADNLYFSADLSSMNQTAPGYYRYKYAMPINTASGYYRAVLMASKQGFQDYNIEPFRVAKGGPYDVRLTIIPPLEVPLSDYLNFQVLLQNMGEVTQDVNLEYWTSYGNQTYYYGGEAILTPTGENKTITRTAYIFSNQPTGTNTLNLRVTYDTVQAPILLNATFQVIDENINIPPPPEQNQTSGTYPGGGGGGGGGSNEKIIVLPPKNVPSTEEAAKGVDAGKIEIEDYNKEINIVRGWSALESVKVKNVGGAPLTNITLALTGIPTLWYKITPKNYESIPPGNNTVFLIEFKVPSNVDSGSYGLTFTANSKESIDEAVGHLVIFTSIEELINRDITNLKIDLGKLQDDTDFSEKLGKDVSRVRDIISQAQTQIKSAEDNMKKKSFDDALQNTQTTSGLIKRGKLLLETASVPEGTVQPVQRAWISAFEILLIIIFIASAALWTLKSKGKLNVGFLQKYAKADKGASEEKKKELSDEKAKIERMLRLLENELKEGIITESAYNELRKRNEEKLERIDSELKKAGG
ncbi:NPCBM-associated, NEW3 domain of alpha-galactosidase [uncultured archaeon]|nr:NPCBM-associated, NEW3 domain of alpha-galactosidase [uncultured archaeon]